MGSIHRRTHSPHWFAAYRGGDGRRYFRSTKKSNRTDALKVMLMWESSASQARDGVFTEAQARKVLNEILEQTGGKSMRVESTESFFKRWLEGVNLANKGKTYERYSKIAEGFMESLGDRAKLQITALNPSDIEAFRDARLKRGVSSTTLSLDIKVVRSVLHQARKQGIILHNPAEAVKLPKMVSNCRDVFAPAQLSMLLKVADEEWKTAILLGYYLGARLGDVVAMTWKNIDLEKGIICFEQQKTGKGVVAPIHPHLEERLLKIAGSDEAEGFLCPTLKSKAISGRSGLSLSFAGLLKKAAIDRQQVESKGKKKRKFSKLSFHSLRHSFTSHLANNGVCEEIRMKLTGHSKSDIHARYTKYDMKPLREAINTLPRI